MFCNIAFTITWLHLYSTNIIIVRYNGWWFQWTNPTWMPYKLHHPAKPYTSNQTHSRDASCEAIISEWLVDIATRFCFVDIQEKAVPPCKKKTSMWGDRQNQIFSNSTNCDLCCMKIYENTLHTNPKKIVGAALYQANKLTTSDMLGLLQFPRHISAQ